MGEYQLKCSLSLYTNKTVVCTACMGWEFLRRCIAIATFLLAIVAFQNRLPVEEHVSETRTRPIPSTYIRFLHQWKKQAELGEVEAIEINLLPLANTANNGSSAKRVSYPPE